MKIIKTFEQFDENGLMQKDFEKYLPESLVILKQVEGKEIVREFKKSPDNIMRNANMTQVTYVATKRLFGHPDEMGIDFYYYHKKGLKLNIDIIYGDMTAAEFAIEPPNKVSVIEYTSKHSKFDPSNTLFALSDRSIESICSFINKIDGFNISNQDLKFLDRRDNFRETD